jgi:hypothetical protein
MTGRARTLAVSALAVAAPVLALLTFLVTSGDTPDPLPSHWDLHGQVNGTTDATALALGFVVASTVVVLAELILVWAVNVATELMPAVLCYVAWALALSYLQIPLAAAGAASAGDVNLPWYAVLVVVVAPILPAALTWRLLPRSGEHAPTSIRHSSMVLGPTERVVWVGSAHSQPMRWIGGGSLVTAAATAFVLPWLALTLGVAGLTITAVSSIGVRIDDLGVHTLWGPVGWPRTTIPLSDIVSAASRDVEPLHWGGWGYRVGRHGVAAVVRAGSGLVIERRSHPTYAVTVDDADQAADVLEALRARRVRETT